MHENRMHNRSVDILYGMYFLVHYAKLYINSDL